MVEVEKEREKKQNVDEIKGRKDLQRGEKWGNHLIMQRKEGENEDVQEGSAPGTFLHRVHHSSLF